MYFKREKQRAAQTSSEKALATTTTTAEPTGVAESPVEVVPSATHTSTTTAEPTAVAESPVEVVASATHTSTTTVDSTPGAAPSVAATASTLATTAEPTTQAAPPEAVAESTAVATPPPLRKLGADPGLAVCSMAHLMATFDPSELIDGGINYYLNDKFSLKDLDKLYPKEVSQWYCGEFLILDKKHRSRLAPAIAYQAALCFASELRLTHVPDGRIFPQLFDEFLYSIWYNAVETACFTFYLIYDAKTIFVILYKLSVKKFARLSMSYFLKCVTFKNYS